MRVGGESVSHNWRVVYVSGRRRESFTSLMACGQKPLLSLGWSRFHTPALWRYECEDTALEVCCVPDVTAWSPGDSAAVEILSSRKDACWMCSGVLFFPWTESNQAWEVCWVTVCILFVRLKMLHQVPTAQTRSTGPVQGLRLDRLPV